LRIGLVAKLAACKGAAMRQIWLAGRTGAAVTGSPCKFSGFRRASPLVAHSCMTSVRVPVAVILAGVSGGETGADAGFVGAAILAGDFQSNLTWGCRAYWTGCYVACTLRRYSVIARGPAMRLILIHCVLSMMIASAAISQDMDGNLGMRFVAEKDPETGKIRLVQVDDEPSIKDESPQAVEALDVVRNGFSDAHGEFGYAYFDSTGELTAIFPKPTTPGAKEAILSQIENGGSLQAVNMFGWGAKLPSQEEVIRITEEAMNAALEMVCSRNPRPETFDMVVSVGVEFGLQGKFEFQSSWRPQRDCDD